MRVWQNAKLIAAEETVDLYVVELAALLHDIADAKFHDGDEELGPNMAADFLRELSISPKVIHHVCQIIRHMSFKGGNEANPFNSREMEVVQDADRLDALGAIGVARAFSYGGYRGRTFFNPAIKPNLNMDKETYRQSAAPTINHFFEKLLVLKDRMHTKKGREVAEDRHGFLLQFLEQFFREMDCDPKWPDE
ncbi:MAG: HD domain-containing protein [Saprospiraceae bacterium]|nr:HD domain-containing protein [Saprospiraceae bacterium]